VGGAGGCVLAAEGAGLFAIGCDLVRRGTVAALELVDQPACLEPVGGRNEADAATAGELLEVVELSRGGWIVCGHGLPPRGCWMEPRAGGGGARCHASREARKPVRVAGGRARRMLAAAPAPRGMGDDRNGHLPPANSIGLTRLVRFYGLVDLSLVEAIELYVRREDAERTLAELLRDEPEWESRFRIEEIEFSGLSWN
jgi:hypothetical protein